jgi:hypothetical protein
MGADLIASASARAAPNGEICAAAHMANLVLLTDVRLCRCEDGYGQPTKLQLC